MKFLSADKIFNGETFLPHGSVLCIENNSIENILEEGIIEKNRIQSLEGILLPGFINAHCHSELSHLKGRISKKTGLPGFGKEIISIRGSYSAGEIKEHLFYADECMTKEGIVACGDICNTSDSIKMKEASSIHYHSFIELLGLHPNRAPEMMKAGHILFELFENAGLKVSLAPHAPYSTSLQLIKQIAEFNLNKGLPSSIHNQESEEETKFFMGSSSGFHDLYRYLQADLSWFEAPKTDSLTYYLSSLLEQQTLLVHNTFSTEKNIISANKKNIFWCFCPNANLYIEDKLPDYSHFHPVKDKICLGTDSLASNDSLSVISEANVLLEKSDFSEPDILKFMTVQGAKALQLPSYFGTLSKGKNAGINQIEIKNKKIRFIKQIL